VPGAVDVDEVDDDVVVEEAVLIVEEEDGVIEEDDDDEVIVEDELVDRLVEAEEVVIEDNDVDELLTDDSTAYTPAAAIMTIITTTAMTIARRPIARLIFNINSTSVHLDCNKFFVIAKNM